MNDQSYFGRVASWKQKEGYGFITSSSHQGDIFFHIRDTFDRNWQPHPGETVKFTVQLDAQGRLRAVNVRTQSAAPQIVGSVSGFDTVLALLTVGAFVILLGLAVFAMVMPSWVVGWYLACSTVTLMLYQEDKQRARFGVWRIRELTLHIWELLGGWPGALLAQQLFRHKISKSSYARYFWGIVSLHIGGILLYLAVTLLVW